MRFPTIVCLPTMAEVKKVKKGELLEFEVEKFADRGKSLARIDGQVVFIPGGVPGDRVRARVIRKKKRYAEARIEELLEPSDLRTTPRCFYFGTCGGCKWQHGQYEAQLGAKRESEREALEHQAGVTGVAVRPTPGGGNQYTCRTTRDVCPSGG